MRITHRPKTSVYQHIKDTPLSPGRMKKYKDAAARHIRRFALARKGKSVRPFRRFESWTPKHVLLIAHLMFDGEIMRRKCVYNNRNTALLSRVDVLMQDVYDYEPARHSNSHTGVRRISYYNVELAAYLNSKALQLLREVQILSPDLKKEFLRAFFDDEGYMDFLPARNRRRVRGYQKDVRILRLIKRLLNDIGIRARIVHPNEVQIVGKEELIKFEQEINFSPGIYMNGNRLNSRWKKHVEKRRLLRKAIESYKS